MEIQTEDNISAVVQKPKPVNPLKPWEIQPGTVLNPAGAGSQLPTLRTKCREFLEQLDPKNPDRNRLQTLFITLFELVEDKNKQATKASELLLSYAYGKAPSSNEDLEAMRESGVKILILPPVAAQPLPLTPPATPTAKVIETTPEND